MNSFLHSEFDTFRCVMDHERVIEVTNAGICMAWLAENPNGERDFITFDLAKAKVFQTHREVVAVLSRLKCGYPTWHTDAAYYTDDYRAEWAAQVYDPTALPSNA